MKGEDLYQAMEHIDDQVLERSQRRKPHRKPLWISAVAAVLVVAVAVGAVLWPKGDVFQVGTYALQTAHYPQLVPRPDPMDYLDADTQEVDFDAYSAAEEAYQESQAALEQEPGYADGLDSFFEKSVPVFLSGKEGENAAYSPLNVYMALAMLAEVTDGESRQQILDLLGSNSLEDTREQAKAVWEGAYQDDGATATILASSVWLRDDLSYNQDTLKTLAENYYASSFQGDMGDEAYTQALRDWLNEQTGGLLEEQTQGIQLRPETVLALATTLYYKAGWTDEFNPENTATQTFHAPSGDVEAEFLHQTMEDKLYYRGEHFGAIGKGLGETTTWLVLPDEGTTPEELLAQGQVVEFFTAGGGGFEWEDRENRKVNLALPKFDITSETNLLEGLATLGVTDVMDPTKSDFSPLTTETQELFLSQAQHDVRVTVDEEGVEAAAYTVLAADTTSAISEPQELDFILDRPFLFAITTYNGLPLFVGIVNQP